MLLLLKTINILNGSSPAVLIPENMKIGRETENVFLNSGEPLYQICLHHGQGFTSKINKRDFIQQQLSCNRVRHTIGEHVIAADFPV